LLFGFDRCDGFDVHAGIVVVAEDVDELTVR
jgi:hypothetical protein